MEGRSTVHAPYVLGGSLRIGGNKLRACALCSDMQHVIFTTRDTVLYVSGLGDQAGFLPSV
jgi:hypothetical protein